MRKAILTAAVLLGLGLAGCSDDDPTGPLFRRTLRVPAQFDTIQEAIDAAVSGDLVLVAAGTYADSVQAENGLGVPIIVCVDLKSGVEVRGDSDQTGDVVLVGNPNNPVVNCNSIDAKTTLSNVTITGGKWGILGARSAVNVVNCVFRENHNTSQWGAAGGMYFDASSPKLINCVFADNSATTGAGAVFANDSHPVLTNVIFSGNTAWSSPNQPGTGGALVLGNDTHAVLTNCLFTANHADSLGGAIEIHHSAIEMVNCNLTGNDTDGLGGAFLVNYGGQVAMTNGVVSDNRAGLAGGGFYFRYASNLTANYSRILGNTAPEGPDGFIDDPYQPSVVTLHCCEIDPDQWVGTIILNDEGCD